MIEWKRVDASNPPEGERLFFYNGSAYSGWIVNNEKDDEGYPIWETSENLLGKCHGVKYYADFNYPSENI
jgi:hypothetical protein